MSASAWRWDSPTPARASDCWRAARPELDLAKLEIEQAGGNALRIRADVRDLEQLSAAVDRMRVVFGGIDILITAAGVQGPIGPLHTTNAKAWNETIETNLIGSVNSCRAVLPGMIEKRSGKIVLIVGGGAGTDAPQLQRVRRVQSRPGAPGRVPGR